MTTYKDIYYSERYQDDEHEYRYASWFYYNYICLFVDLNI